MAETEFTATEVTVTLNDFAAAVRDARITIAEAWPRGWGAALWQEQGPPEPLPAGLVERPLTEEDLRQMIQRELPTSPDRLPGSDHPAPDYIRVANGKRERYYFDVVDGNMLGHCIQTRRGGWKNDLVEVLAKKHLVDFDEDLFLRVADNDAATNGRWT